MAVVQDVELAEQALQQYLGAATDAQRDAAYLEIWRRLDVALADARAEGKDTARIDAVRAALGDRATTPPVPPDESGIDAARTAFAWFRSHYAALNLGAGAPVPLVGPSELQKGLLSGAARVIIVLCAIGGLIALVGMRYF